MKSILITGAFGGMGKATSQLLAEMGYRVFALDLRVKEACENIIPIKADITDEESLNNAVEVVKSYTDELFAIIHFAGIYMLDSLVEMGKDAFERIYKINFLGAFLVNKCFLPLLKKGSKILITTSELASLNPLPFTGIYAIMKGALDKYAFSLRMELQLLGIDVCVLRAGAVKTDMLGVSTNALDRFVEKTKLYSCNAKRFKSIVDRVEAKSIPTEKLAHRVAKIIKKKKPAFAYSINRNPLLLTLSILPHRIQFFAISKVLK